jgi:hypothetical protein
VVFFAVFFAAFFAGMLAIMQTLIGLPTTPISLAFQDDILPLQRTSLFAHEMKFLLHIKIISNEFFYFSKKLCITFNLCASYTSEK